MKNLQKKYSFFLIVACFLWAVCRPVFAQDLLGERLKVTAEWDGKTATAQRLQFRDANKNPQQGLVVGKISSLDRKNFRFSIGPVQIQLAKSTSFLNMTPENFQPGKAVRVKVRITAEGVLTAAVIESRETNGDYFQILGAVSASRAGEKEGLQLEILSVPVNIPADVYNRGASLIRNPDDKRPSRQLTVSLFGKPLTIGGEFGIKSRFNGDFKLNKAKEDDQLDLDNAIQLEFFYRLSRTSSIFIEGKTSRSALLYHEAGKQEKVYDFDRGEAWIYWGNMFGSKFSLQIGRQNFRETREWWWDRDLDAIRIYVNKRRFYFEMGLAKEIAPRKFNRKQVDPDQDGVTRLLGRLSYGMSKDHQFDLFYILQHDFSKRPAVGDLLNPDREDEEDVSLAWIGPRFSGEFELEAAGDLKYWLDAAGMIGRIRTFGYADVEIDGEEKLIVDDKSAVNAAGWAFDTGFSWISKLPLKPTLTMSYAIASGDKNDNDNLNGTFHQTGIHRNNNRYSGVDRFRYYGELFRPELSNISILSASAGFDVLRSSSVEFLFHRYTQFYPSKTLRGKIKAKTTGSDPRLGWEWDVIFGLEEWERLEIELGGGLFRAGKAFGPEVDKLAYQFTFKMDFNF